MANHNDFLEPVHGKVFLHHASGTDLDKMLDDMQARNELELAESLDDTEPLKQPPCYALMMVDAMPVNAIHTDGKNVGCRERNPSNVNDETS